MLLITTFLNSPFSLLMLHKIFLFLFWFTIGFLFNNKLSSKSRIKSIINTLTFFELSIILYTVFLILYTFLILFSLWVVNLNIIDVLFLGADSTSSSNSTVTLTLYSGRATDGVIMTGALAAGAKVQKNIPSIGNKVAWLGGSIVLGRAAIAVKNTAGNISKNVGNKLIKTTFLDQMFNLTGNSAIDLLTLIQFFQKLQIIFTVGILYSLFLNYINTSEFKNYLYKILPVNIAEGLSKVLVYFKKSNKIVIVCLFILLLVSNYYSYYYLDFYLRNIDKIIEVYFNK